MGAAFAPAFPTSLASRLVIWNASSRKKGLALVHEKGLATLHMKGPRTWSYEMDSHPSMWKGLTGWTGLWPACIYTGGVCCIRWTDSRPVELTWGMYTAASFPVTQVYGQWWLYTGASCPVEPAGIFAGSSLTVRIVYRRFAPREKPAWLNKKNSQPKYNIYRWITVIGSLKPKMCYCYKRGRNQ